MGLPLINDTMGLRISFNTKHNDGFQTNTVNGERADSDDSNAVRLQLLTKFNDDVSLTFRGDYLRDDSRPPVAFNYLHGNLDSLQYQSELFYSTGTARSRLDTFGSSATLDWQLGDYKLTSISAWRGVNTVNAFDSDGTTAASFEVPHSDLTDRSLTQEVFVSGQKLAGLPLDWVGGVFYLHEETSYLWSLKIFAPPSGQDFAQKVDSVGRLLSRHVACDRQARPDRRRPLHHRAQGLRRQQRTGGWLVRFRLFEPRHGDEQVDLARSGELPVGPACPAVRERGDRLSQRRLNGNAQSLADVTGGAFQPEDTLMYEAGVKSEFWDHRLRINADYYYGRYNHLQEAVVLQNGAVSSTNNTAHVNGLELEAKLVPLAGMELSATVGTLHDTIQGSTTELPDAPRLNWNLAATYSHELSALGTGTLGVSFSHTGSSYEDAANTPILQVQAHNNVRCARYRGNPGRALAVHARRLQPDEQDLSDRWIRYRGRLHFGNRVAELAAPLGVVRPVQILGGRG